MKRIYLSPAIKLREVERIMLDLSSSEGGPQLTKGVDFEDNDDIGGSPSIGSSNGIWDEDDTDNDMSL